MKAFGKFIELLLFGHGIVLKGFIWGPNPWMNYFSSVIIKFPLYATTSGTHELFFHEEMNDIKGNTYSIQTGLESWTPGL